MGRVYESWVDTAGPGISLFFATTDGSRQAGGESLGALAGGSRQLLLGGPVRRK